MPAGVKAGGLGSTLHHITYSIKAIWLQINEGTCFPSNLFDRQLGPKYLL